MMSAGDDNAKLKGKRNKVSSVTAAMPCIGSYRVFNTPIVVYSQAHEQGDASVDRLRFVRTSCAAAPLPYAKSEALTGKRQTRTWTFNSIYTGHKSTIGFSSRTIDRWSAVIVHAIGVDPRMMMQLCSVKENSREIWREEHSEIGVSSRVYRNLRWPIEAWWECAEGGYWSGKSGHVHCPSRAAPSENSLCGPDCFCIPGTGLA
jgi:hypothetical protein